MQGMPEQPAVEQVHQLLLLGDRGQYVDEPLARGLEAREVLDSRDDLAVRGLLDHGLLSHGFEDPQLPPGGSSDRGWAEAYLWRTAGQVCKAIHDDSIDYHQV